MLSTFALKIIAIIAMLTDHTGAVLFPDSSILRLIGRLAFPIFAFSIAEGFAHTKNSPKYLLRLGLFALLSEIPFNLAFSGRAFNLGSCNIYITLFLGLLSLMLFDSVKNWEGIPRFAAFIAALIPVAVLCRAADTLHSDYGKYGVMLIFVFYIFRKNRTASILMFIFCTMLKYGITSIGHADAVKLFELGSKSWYFSDQTQLYCILAAIPIALYSGRSGYRGAKWLFYIFYPVHLILLWLISLCV